MIIPDALNDIIQQSLAFIEQNPDHNLSLGYRQAIWAKFGPHLDPAIPESLKAHKNRAFLAIQTVKLSLPLWEKKWPADRTPHRIVDEAEKLLNGILSYPNEEEGYHQYDKFWVYFDNKTHDENAGSFYEMTIGYGAALSFNVTLMDEVFNENDINLNRPDNYDPYDFDTAQNIAIAYANGGVLNKGSDKQKRKEFWEWWLVEAVPQAYCNIT